MGQLRRVKKMFFWKQDWKKKVDGKWGDIKIKVQVTQTEKSLKRKLARAGRALGIIGRAMGKSK